MIYGIVFSAIAIACSIIMFVMVSKIDKKKRGNDKTDKKQAERRG